MTTSGSQTETYTSTKDTTEATVVARIVTQSEQIARYFTEDLTHFIDETNFNLIEELQIPSEYARSSEEAIELLYDDLSHMLRDRVITGIHLLLSEQKIDPNSQSYPLRYHAMYLITAPPTTAPTRTLQDQQKQQGGLRFGGLLAPPKNSWINARFALLIDWDLSANERRRQVRRPEYHFDWVPRQERFDATTLVRFREGGMTYDGASVDRTESKSAGF